MTIESDFKKSKLELYAPSPLLGPHLGKDLEKGITPSPVKASVSISMLSMALPLSSTAKMNCTSSAL